MEDPQDDENCPTCNGTGKVDCEYSCSECGDDGQCKNQDAQEFKRDCPMCEGCGTISGSAARSLRQEQQDEANEQRWEAEREDRMIGDRAA